MKPIGQPVTINIDDIMKVIGETYLNSRLKDDTINTLMQENQKLKEAGNNKKGPKKDTK